MIENYGNVRAVLNELRLALKNLRETGGGRFTILD